jgi:hypothetical protein
VMEAGRERLRVGEGRLRGRAAWTEARREVLWDRGAGPEVWRER